MNSIFKYPKAKNLEVAIVWKNSWLALMYSEILVVPWVNIVVFWANTVGGNNCGIRGKYSGILDQ